MSDARDGGAEGPFSSHRSRKKTRGGRVRRRDREEDGGDDAQRRQLTTTWKRDRYGGFNISSAARVDRTVEAPVLLRCFVMHNQEPRPEQFVGRLPRDVHVYTWRDVTLREVAQLLKEVDAEAGRPGALVDFYLVHPTVGKEKEMTVRPIGLAAGDDSKSNQTKVLKQTKRLYNDSQFEAGDYLVANVLP